MKWRMGVSRTATQGTHAKTGLEKKNRSVHFLRHSCATHVLEAGADVRTVSELRGHTSRETTARYTHMRPQTLRRMDKSFHSRENALYAEVDEE